MANEYESFTKVKGTKLESQTAATVIVTQATVNNNVTNTADVVVQFLRAAYGPDNTKPSTGDNDFGRTREALLNDIDAIRNYIAKLKTWPPA